MHLNSCLLFENFAREHFRSGARVLEIGPDKFPSTYQSIVDDRSITWHTLDLYESPELTYSASSEYSFPIPDDTYDIVLSGQVMEHVRRIWVWMKELARVCRVGGLVITINPVSWPYHEVPVDCWRVFPEGMKVLYEDAALDVILSRCESLEATNYRRHIPGRSFPGHHPVWVQDTFRALGGVGFPVECAYDTITVGAKTGAAPQPETTRAIDSV